MSKKVGKSFAQASPQNAYNFFFKTWVFKVQNKLIYTYHISFLFINQTRFHSVFLYNIWKKDKHLISLTIKYKLMN